jgi:hypothetical protein
LVELLVVIAIIGMLVSLLLPAVMSLAMLSEVAAKPVRILDPATVGPIDGPIWVAPQEDMVFHCSPGPGKKFGLGPGDKNRKL